jgi:CheY-like chemotaxis protein
MHKDLAILYVEDDVESREVMSLLLTEVIGLSNVTIFPDSLDFMKRVEGLHPQPDLFLLDIHVKPNNGFAMLQMLRNHGRFGQTPVIALTASVMNEEVRTLKLAGFNGVIAKPIDMDIFPELLDRVLKAEKVWGIAD